MSRQSKVIACTDTHIVTQTDRHTYIQYENITFPHTQAVIKMLNNRLMMFVPKRQFMEDKDVNSPPTSICGYRLNV